MTRINLHDEFIKSLYGKIPQKKYLADMVSEILRIEKEPASRRLNGKVQFSVQEIGLLATELGISLDSLLYKNNQLHWIPFVLESPLGADSIEHLCDRTEAIFERMQSIMQEPTEFGGIVSSLPIELYMYHPYLLKFMFFKWGHYFVGTDEFNDFSQWKLPERCIKVREKLSIVHNEIKNVLYIWDDSLIWTLAGEIDYFHKMNIINAKDKEDIKNDLKKMLTQLEGYLKGTYKMDIMAQKNTSFYVSNINIGVTSWYLFSAVKGISYFHTNFSFSRADESYENAVKIKKWVDSFKNISVLISGSGSLERRYFFDKQHKIIDLF